MVANTNTTSIAWAGASHVAFQVESSEIDWFVATSNLPRISWTKYWSRVWLQQASTKLLIIPWFAYSSAQAQEAVCISLKLVSKTCRIVVSCAQTSQHTNRFADSNSWVAPLSLCCPSHCVPCSSYGSCGPNSKQGRDGRILSLVDIGPLIRLVNHDCYKSPTIRLYHTSTAATR